MRVFTLAGVSFLLTLAALLAAFFGGARTLNGPFNGMPLKESTEIKLTEIYLKTYHETAKMTIQMSAITGANNTTNTQ